MIRERELCFMTASVRGPVAVLSWDFMSDMSWPFSVQLLGFAGCLQCCCPPQQVINHRLGLRPKLGESFVHVAALEMCPKGRNGNVDGRANRGNLNLYHGFPELLDAARAHGAAVAYESSRFAVPLPINPVDR